jgi:hypothetical protein
MRAARRMAIGAVATACGGGIAALGVALVLSSAAAAAAPTAGHYDARLCVSHGAQPPSCGAAEVEVRPGGDVRVQVSDIVYRVRVKTGQAAVVVMQGTMQIDEFVAGAEWEGAALRFADDDKQVRYEVQVGSPRPAPK